MAHEDNATPPESIIRKIQKLLELGSRAKSNEEEAAVAMGMAQELLAKYNLDMAVVREAQVAGGTVPIDAPRETKKINRSAQYDWQKTLWKTLSEANFCWHHVQTFQEKLGTKRDGTTRWARVKRHVVLGKVENVAIVHMMGDYLCDTIERLLPFVENRDRLSRDAISWRAGCAARLEERIRKQRLDRLKADQKAQEENGPGTGLALVNVEIREYKDNYDFTFGKGAYDNMMAKQKAWDEAQAAKESRPETPEEMRKRQAADARWEKQRQRERQAQANKYNPSQFREGYVKGNDISLNSQLSKGTQTPSLE